MKWMRLTALLLAAMPLALFSGCFLFDKEEASSSEPEPAGIEEEIDPEYPVTAAGVTVSGRPGQVVSLAPSVTEKLYDLGLEDRLAGISDYCDYPDTIISLPACGTSQLPDLEEIERIGAQLILTESPLSDEAMAALDQQGVPVAVFPRAENVEGLMATYKDMARLLEGELSGAAMAGIFTEAYVQRLQSLQSSLSGYTAESGRKKILYLRLLDFTVATGDSFEQQLFDYACFDNVAVSQASWSYPEELAKGEGQADFVSIDIIFMDDAFVTINMLEQSAFYKGLPAVLKDRYLYISSIALERQSMRTVFMLEDMAAYVYPEADVFAATAPEAQPSDEPADGEAALEEKTDPGTENGSGGDE